MAAEKGTSVLASLTSQVMADKKAEARKLTPVAGEVGALPTTPASFPNDMPQEVVEQKVKELTRIIEHLTEARDALAGLAKVPVAEKSDPLAEQKAAERAADEKAAAKANDNEPVSFAEKFEAQKKAAQAATFKDSPETEVAAPENEAEPPPSDEWHCPVHDKPGVTKTSDKTGRTYVGCPDCNAFKR